MLRWPEKAVGLGLVVFELVGSDGDLGMRYEVGNSRHYDWGNESVSGWCGWCPDWGCGMKPDDLDCWWGSVERGMLVEAEVGSGSRGGRYVQHGVRVAGAAAGRGR
jgi:hypothetical protein